MPADEPEVVSVLGASKPIGLLIVEDEALVASYIREVLEDSGFAIVGVASSGREALALAAETRPRLALVDIRLAGPMDGIDVARQLREDFGIPAIFLSGIVDGAVEERAKAAQPLGFLHKPFLPSQVFNTIERVLSGSKN